MLSVWLAAASLSAQDFDILIQNGRIADGTGNPSFLGDVGIKGGRIAGLGKLSGKTAARTIDAKGLVVSPGFIDMHNHSDEAILADGNAESMIRMGVTSMILGEGSSSAPTPEIPALPRLLGCLAQTRSLHEYRLLRWLRLDLPKCARIEARSSHRR